MHTYSALYYTVDESVMQKTSEAIWAWLHARPTAVCLSEISSLYSVLQFHEHYGSDGKLYYHFSCSMQSCALYKDYNSTAWER